MCGVAAAKEEEEANSTEAAVTATRPAAPWCLQCARPLRLLSRCCRGSFPSSSLSSRSSPCSRHRRLALHPAHSPILSIWPHIRCTTALVRHLLLRLTVCLAPGRFTDCYDRSRRMCRRHKPPAARTDCLQRLDRVYFRGERRYDDDVIRRRRENDGSVVTYVGLFLARPKFGFLTLCHYRAVCHYCFYIKLGSMFYTGLNMISPLDRHHNFHVPVGRALHIQRGELVIRYQQRPPGCDASVGNGFCVSRPRWQQLCPGGSADDSNVPQLTSVRWFESWYKNTNILFFCLLPSRKSTRESESTQHPIKPGLSYGITGLNVL